MAQKTETLSRPALAPLPMIDPKAAEAELRLRLPELSKAVESLERAREVRYETLMQKFCI